MGNPFIEHRSEVAKDFDELVGKLPATVGDVVRVGWKHEGSKLSTRISSMAVGDFSVKRDTEESDVYWVMLKDMPVYVDYSERGSFTKAVRKSLDTGQNIKLGYKPLGTLRGTLKNLGVKAKITKVSCGEYKIEVV